MKTAALLCLTFLLLNVSAYSSTDGSTTTAIAENKFIHYYDVPAWSSSTSYSTGTVVVYMGRVYRAAHWTQGDTPRGFGLYPDGPWMDEGLYI